MLELLGTIFGSIFSGGATGIVGVLAQRYADYKNKEIEAQMQKDRMEHERNLRSLDMKITQAEYEGKVKVASIEMEGKKEEFDAGAFQASFKLEPPSFSSGVKPTKGQAWVLVILDTVRGLVRPGITLYLCILTTLVYRELQKVSPPTSSEQVYEMLRLIVGTILYLWTTCTLWWFGTRNKQQPPRTTS